jgi:Tol biopolymer transport system component
METHWRELRVWLRPSRDHAVDVRTAVESCGMWMPDSRRVVFRSSDAGRLDIFRRMADGTGAVEPLTRQGAGGEPQSISPDGKFLVFRAGGSVSNADLMVRRAARADGREVTPAAAMRSTQS